MMTDTTAKWVEYGDEEIMRLKTEEMERIERQRIRGTVPDQPQYEREPKLNRHERRKLRANIN